LALFRRQALWRFDVKALSAYLVFRPNPRRRYSDVPTYHTLGPKIFYLAKAIDQLVNDIVCRPQMRT